MNQTIVKFGYPDTLIHEYDSWLVLLRPRQATLGALVLACKESVGSFSQVSATGFSELRQATADLEQALSRSFDYDKINYLMLMMIDPDVHFHVLPRYQETRVFFDSEFEDQGWPGPPRLDLAAKDDPAVFGEILKTIRLNWP